MVGKPAELGGLVPRTRALATGLLAVLDETLGDALVELVDHTAQLAVLRFRGGDDERIGCRVGLNLTACGGLCRRSAGPRGVCRRDT